MNSASLRRLPKILPLEGEKSVRRRIVCDPRIVDHRGSQEEQLMREGALGGGQRMRRLCVGA